MNISIKKNNKFKLYFITIKKSIFSIFILLFIISIIIYSPSCINSAKSAIKIWFNNILPTLLPFFIAINLLNQTNLINSISLLFNNLMPSLFNVSKNSTYAFILGLISGSPIGAKIISDLRDKDLCTSEEAQRLLVYTNNTSPIFIINTIGISLFSSSLIGILLFISNILSSITIGCLLGIFQKNSTIKSYSTIDKNYNTASNISINNLGYHLTNSILNSIKSVILIGGFIVLFSIILNLLKTYNILKLFYYILSPLLKLFNINYIYFEGFISGLIELTNGIFVLANIPNKNISINLILISFLISFGGLSIILQIISIYSKQDISIKKFIKHKFFQAFISSFYTFLLLNIPIFNLNI